MLFLSVFFLLPQAGAYGVYMDDEYAEQNDIADRRDGAMISFCKRRDKFRPCLAYTFQKRSKVESFAEGIVFGTYFFFCRKLDRIGFKWTMYMDDRCRMISRSFAMGPPIQQKTPI